MVSTWRWTSCAAARGGASADAAAHNAHAPNTSARARLMSEFDLRGDAEEPRRLHRHRLQPRALRHERRVVREDGARVQDVVDVERDNRSHAAGGEPLADAQVQLL